MTISGPVPSAPPPLARPATEDESITAMTRAKAGLMETFGLAEPAARAVVLAIARVQIPHLTITLETRHAG